MKVINWNVLQLSFSLNRCEEVSSYWDHPSAMKVARFGFGRIYFGDKFTGQDEDKEKIEFIDKVIYAYQNKNEQKAFYQILDPATNPLWRAMQQKTQG